MEPHTYKTEEKNLYILGWIFLLLILFLSIFSELFHMKIRLSGFPCIFHSLTGYYCPGCGGTRACRALLEGRLADSFLFHPVVPYAAAVYAWFMISHTLESLSKGRLQIGMRYRDIYLYLAGGIILLQWIIRNLIKFLWGFDVL